MPLELTHQSSTNKRQRATADVPDGDESVSRHQEAIDHRGDDHEHDQWKEADTCLEGSVTLQMISLG